MLLKPQAFLASCLLASTLPVYGGAAAMPTRATPIEQPEISPHRVALLPAASQHTLGYARHMASTLEYQGKITEAYRAWRAAIHGAATARTPWVEKCDEARRQEALAAADYTKAQTIARQPRATQSAALTHIKEQLAAVRETLSALERDTRLEEEARTVALAPYKAELQTLEKELSFYTPTAETTYLMAHLQAQAAVAQASRWAEAEPAILFDDFAQLATLKLKTIYSLPAQEAGTPLLSTNVDGYLKPLASRYGTGDVTVWEEGNTLRLFHDLVTILHGTGLPADILVGMTGGSSAVDAFYPIPFLVNLAVKLECVTPDFKAAHLPSVHLVRDNMGIYRTSIAKPADFYEAYAFMASHIAGVMRLRINEDVHTFRTLISALSDAPPRVAFNPASPFIYSIRLESLLTHLGVSDGAQVAALTALATRADSTAQAAFQILINNNADGPLIIPPSILDALLPPTKLGLLGVLTTMPPCHSWNPVDEPNLDARISSELAPLGAGEAPRDITYELKTAFTRILQRHINATVLEKIADTVLALRTPAAWLARPRATAKDAAILRAEAPAVAGAGTKVAATGSGVAILPDHSGFSGTTPTSPNPDAQKQSGGAAAVDSYSVWSDDDNAYHNYIGGVFESSSDAAKYSITS